MDYTQLGEQIAVAPQISRQDIADIAASGFVGIINNRPDGEAPDQPASQALEAEARRLGLRYWHLPIVPGAMSSEDVRAFAGLLAQADGPVLAFCRTGTRSSNLFKAAQALP